MRRDIDISHPEFGERLLHLRTEAGLSRNDLAERSGLSAKTIANLEEGAYTKARDKTLLLIADALHLSYGELVYGTKPPKTVDGEESPESPPDGQPVHHTTLYVAMIVAASLVFIGVMFFNQVRQGRPANPHGAILTNLANKRQYSVEVTAGTAEKVELSGDEITDGDLGYEGSADDGCAGWQNLTDGELLELTVTIDLGELCRITEIRYNPGHVFRAQTWNADVMITDFAETSTNPGRTYSGVWTTHYGKMVTSKVKVILRKTKTAPDRDWLFIGEIECVGEPLASEAPERDVTTE